MKKILLLIISALLILPYSSCTKPSPVEPGEEPEEGGSGNQNNPEDTTGGGTPEDTTTYAIGDYIEVGLSKGIVYHIDTTGRHGLMMSLDQGKAAWSTDYEMLTSQGGEFSPSDGFYNMQYIKYLENWQERYPAFAWCDQKNVLGLNAWFLPSWNDFEYIYASFDIINEALIAQGSEPLHAGPMDNYWTSMEMGVMDAYAFSFYYGELSSYDTDKQMEHYVFAVRSF
ncbi:MAG: hypothetical protein J6U71_06400 [Bacteroidales bacterium]|nr:hypothetical protein [Bacteroidales bacterium]MBO7284674.1 hypothetical protein [Bacteroidales bacterium]MBO7322803.1 hypothetical protein [Bacteroidales bacterium]